MDFRKRYKISYYLDRVYAFQIALDIVNETVQDDVLCWHSWDEFEQQVIEANQAWEKVLSDKPESDLLEPLEINQLNIQQQATKVTDALNILTQVVQCADREHLQLKAENTELAFQEFLQLFGNYANPKAPFAWNQ